jgi:hypothetical protein
MTGRCRPCYAFVEEGVEANWEANTEQILASASMGCRMWGKTRP